MKKNAPKSNKESSPNTLLEFSNVSLHKKDKKILDNINFVVTKGDIITIIGPNGGGKTTLAKLALGILKPSSGNILKHTSKIGYMPQKININAMLPITVREFLVFDTDEYKKKKELESDESLKGLLEKQIHHLSGGELQRVLFKKSILKNPDLLVLDEPTQALDVKGQDAFYNKINSLRKQEKKTILMISHDLHTVMKSSDQVICLNHNIHCCGKPSDVQDHSSYKEMFPKSTMITTYSHKHNRSGSND